MFQCFDNRLRRGMGQSDVLSFGGLPGIGMGIMADLFQMTGMTEWMERS